MLFRLQRLQKNLSENSCILISNPYNIEYLAGVKGLSYKEREYFLLISKKDAWLITARMFKTEGAEAEIVKSGLADLVLLKEREGFFETVKKVLPFSTKKLFIEEYDLKLVEYLRLKKLLFPIQIKHLKDQVYNLRLRKDLEEIKRLKKAQELTAKVLEKAVRFLKENFSKGLTEKDLASFIVSETLKLEFSELSFDPIVAYGPNSAIPHHKSSKQKIGEGVLLIDLGVRYKGYCGDLTRTFYLGKPDEKFLQRYELVQKALDKAIDEVKSRKKFIDIHNLAVGIFKEKNLHDKFLHSIGHGVGLEIHERPFARGGKMADTLEKNSVITLEPGLYFEGEYGIRIEEMVWVKKNTGIVVKVFGRRMEEVEIKV